MVIKPMAGQQHGWRATKNMGRGPSVHVQDYTISHATIDRHRTRSIIQQPWRSISIVQGPGSAEGIKIQDGILENGTHSIRLTIHLVIQSFHQHRDQTSICSTRRPASSTAMTPSRIHKASPSSAILYHNNEA
jgi:hypothetical protein